MTSYKHWTKAGLAGVAAIALGIAVPASAQMPVFDGTNYSQNILQAARALEQINHQIESLQNEATMLENMARNLKTLDFPQLQAMNAALQKIDGLMNRAQAIGFKPGAIDASFNSLFRGTTGSALKGDQRVAEAKSRLDAALASFRHSMNVQAEVVSNIQADSSLLDELAGKSQGSVGSLQAQQAANQLLALSAKQQFQLQDLMAAEFRSQSIERAARAQSEADGRAATVRFLGTGKSYSSTRE